MPKPEPSRSSGADFPVIGASPSNALSIALTAVFGTLLAFGANPAAEARDILRGGKGGSNAPQAVPRGNVNVPPSIQARAQAQNRLARTTQALQAMQAMQKAARAAAIAGQNNLGWNPNKPGQRLPNVPNGLGPGGLQVAPGVTQNSNLWRGANLPKQAVVGGRTTVTLKQTEQQAVLNWETFNIGKNTTLRFDQSKGGANAGKWIAFNKVTDPTGVPSQILGSIEAQGQVYVINPNGIIFGGSSQVNTRALVASALPINDNLIRQGLLNNRDAQFLFSALSVPGGADGTPAFYPTTTDRAFFVGADSAAYTLGIPVAVTSGDSPVPVKDPEFTFTAANGARTKLIAETDYTLSIDPTTKKATANFTAAGIEKISGAAVSVTYAPVAVKAGNVVVQRGAVLSSPVSGDGNGGRVMLVGANVTNAGTISTPAGQTILAAGSQVGVAAHASSDPSLRGLDVWVGAVGEGAGKVTNSGVIESLTGSVSMSGRNVNQFGAIESSTSVNLNGRIDIRASYGAVANPNFDNAEGAGGPPFLFQSTGVVTFGEGSVTRILPDYLSTRTVPGTALPESSQINVEGLAIHFRREAMMQAPNGDVTVRAGVWPYKDTDGNRTTFDATGAVETGLVSYLSGTGQKFLFSSGQIYLDPSSFIDVSGSTDVFVPLAHSILNVEFRGSELADSPLQREGILRATPLTVDLRRTGVYNGRYWMGTPLGDVTGLAGLIERNAAQLTAAGGNVSLRAGGSIVVRDGATVDVSGGYYRHEGGMVKTTRLLQDGRLVDIADAAPGQIYDGVYTGKFTKTYSKWGVTETYSVPFVMGERYEPGYIQGADGGTLALTAPSMALDGELLGQTVRGPRERGLPADYSSLSISFSAEKTFVVSSSDIKFLPVSPTPPKVIFSRDTTQTAVEPFQLAGDVPVALPADRVASVFLSPELLEENGFGHLSVENTDGSITVPADVRLAAPARGSISLAAANVTVLSDVSAPGGALKFVAYNISPAFTAEFPIANQGTPTPAPAPNEGRGLFTLGTGATLSTAGLIVDDRSGSPTQFTKPMVIEGGSISVESFSANLANGSTIDVSGGVAVSAGGDVTYGDGGSISIRTGKDPGFGTVLGGELSLNSTLMGYSGATGGSLTLRAGMIQIGGFTSSPGTLLLQPAFFRQGGFSSYALEGIGAATGETVESGEPDTYLPAITIAPGTRIAPVAESWLALPHDTGSEEVVLRRILEPVGRRSPVSLSFSASGVDDPFTIDFLEVRSDIVMGRGAQIITDPGATVSFKGDTITILGSISAPGGAITIEGADEFPLRGQHATNATFARSTVYIGAQAALSTAGTTVTVPDAYGRCTGTLFPGGVISVSGNIVANAGAVLDVSGSSTIFDVHPSRLGTIGSTIVPLDSGVTPPLWSLRTVPVQMDSNGGLIDLQGSEMLFSDATLLGRAGGPTAIGGTLSVFSGRFYSEGALRTSADINLTVTQSGNFIASTNTRLGVALPVLSASGTPLTGAGYFAADRFAAGEFHSLDLGAKFIEDANPIAFGGNVEFRGAVSINAPGSLRVAAGGVIEANAPVSLSASYLAIGQPFRAPLHPDDPLVLFQQSSAAGIREYNFAPTSGRGSLTIQAGVIDTGTLSLQNIGGASFIADGGDIRGNGTVNIAGDLYLRAGQIYPTSASDFTITAFDRNVVVASSSSGSTQVELASPVLPPGFRVGSPLLGSTVQSINGTTVTLTSGANTSITAKTPVNFAAGSVMIIGSGNPSAPLSAGGTLSIFASRISQGGTLRAPLGAITLGWDGTDFDLSDADLDKPLNRIAGTTFGAPVAQRVTLRSGSLTSVSAVSVSGAEMVIPYGLSPDGLSWIDPRGLNVTIAGLPEKRVSVAGNTVVSQAGSTVDIRGGGDLYAYRWVPGIGGSTDILGTASREWSGGGEYQPGDLVTYNGKTWSARVRHAGETPSISMYWSLVPESYAVLPGYGSQVAPVTPFNSGAKAASLGGDAGYVSNALSVGDRIFLDGVQGLDAGVYTLLPRRYALLPGAFLVTPTSGAPLGTVSLPDGSSFASGYTLNALNRPQQDATLRTRFEVLSSEVLRSRAQYDDYYANSFMQEAADRFDLPSAQRLPTDSGYLGFHGNTMLRPEGHVLTVRPTGGRGAAIDLSSFGEIHVVGGRGSAPAGAGSVLRTNILSSWGAESLLIGGLRRDGANGTLVDVRTSKLVLNNRGDIFSAPDITLASKGELTLTAGSSIVASGMLSESADRLVLSGDGTLLRVSSDAGASITRTGLADSTAPQMNIGAGVTIAGAGVILDSTYGTFLDPTTNLQAGALTLGSGQISIVLDEQSGGLTGGVVDPHLTIAGQFLHDIQQVQTLTLHSYRTIDFYGTGSFGNGPGGRLTLSAGGVRGFEQGSGTVALQAGDILFTNPSDVDPLASSGVASGTFQVDAGRIRFGANTFSVASFADVQLNASGSVLGQGSGEFTTPGNLTITTPLITGTQRATYGVTAGGTLRLEQGAGPVTGQGGLGASFTFTGADVVANTTVLLPSGKITLRATSGDVTVGGNLDVSGTRQEFYDLVRYSDAGTITLQSDTGDVELQEGSRVSVSAPAGGGNAGSVVVKASQGAFASNGATLLGRADAHKASGSFLMDVGTLASFTDVSSLLNDGGFFEQRNFRVRTGDVVISNVGDQANIARNFTVSTDQGDIRVTGTIDASGVTGGKIALVAGGDLILEAGSKLTVHAETFNSAGKGGDIRLEAGAASNGVPNLDAVLDVRTGSVIDLGVDSLVAGSYTDVGSSAFYGQFAGKLHLRTPRNGNDVNVNGIGGSILGASSVLVEGYRIYDRTSIGTLDNALRTQIDTDARNFMNAGYDAMHAKLLAGNPDAAGLDSVLVIAPGVEIINTNGDLVLGTPNAANGNATSTHTADWDLSGFRYGPKNAAGVLTLRASGDLVFNNALSDGFTPVTANATNGHSRLWLAPLMDVNPNLPVNMQSWSYRFAAGSDLQAADFRAVVPNAGSLLLGEFYNPIPNGSGVATGENGTTANSIRISTNNTDRGTRYEVIRTGAGDIDIATGRDVQLRNQFATIYTAGVRLSDPTSIFAPNDFVRPVVERTPISSADQGNLGEVQQVYSAQWSMAGGDVTISADGDIGRFTMLNGEIVADSSRQLPNNWLYRRGYVDPSTGLFAQGGVDVIARPGTVTDAAASTTWWIDFSNFFQGFGALGGGNVSLLAGSDIINADAVTPTNARMPGRDSATGLNLAPDASKLVELGGGDVTIRAGSNIDGGTYYVERGSGTLFAGGSITTNASRSPSLGILASQPEIFDSRTWLPTTLFVGKSHFDVSARGDILLGPVTNPFLLPQGVNNKFWYKTYFNTFSEDAGATVASFGGSVTHRLAVTLSGGSSAQSILGAWLRQQVPSTSPTPWTYQPWIRLAEASTSAFETVFTVGAPTLRSTAFAGDVNVVGSMSLFPSSSGTIELAASGSVLGLQPAGLGALPGGRDATIWTSAKINVSDANPALIPGVTTPLAYSSFVGRNHIASRSSSVDFYASVTQMFQETGSYTGDAATIEVQQALHSPGLLHEGDSEPVRLYAKGGDITGLTLFSPKAARVVASNDITDIAIYIQNVSESDISVVSAGRDIIPYNENAPLRSLAGDITRGNGIGDPLRSTVAGVPTNALAGDIQISGPGVLEVFAGHNLDLGTGANFTDGTGVGISSIGSARNPYLPQTGADIIVFAGVSGAGGGPALNLTGSSLDFGAFIEAYLPDGNPTASAYLAKLESSPDLDELTEEQKAIVALETFYGVLRESGRAGADAGYTEGFAAIDTLFGSEKPEGEIFTRARDIRTTAGGAISMAAPGGGLTMASDIFGNPLTPPGIVTEYGGAVSVFTNGSVDIGQARLFTLRGGDIIMWASAGDIAAGTAAKTVVTAPPTRVLIDATSGAVQTDLGGLATGGGIGVLASVEGVQAGDVDLIAPGGAVDAGDAGIRVTGNLNIAAVTVLNAANIQVGGAAGGVPAAAPVSAPNIGGLSAASNTAGAAASAAAQVAQPRKKDDEEDEKPSIIVVEVVGYGGGEE